MEVNNREGSGWVGTIKGVQIDLGAYDMCKGTLLGGTFKKLWVLWALTRDIYSESVLNPGVHGLTDLGRLSQG